MALTLPSVPVAETFLYCELCLWSSQHTRTFAHVLALVLSLHFLEFFPSSRQHLKSKQKAPAFFIATLPLWENPCSSHSPFSFSAFPVFCSGPT